MRIQTLKNICGESYKGKVLNDKNFNKAKAGHKDLLRILIGFLAILITSLSGVLSVFSGDTLAAVIIRITDHYYLSGLVFFFSLVLLITRGFKLSTFSIIAISILVSGVIGIVFERNFGMWLSTFFLFLSIALAWFAIFIEALLLAFTSLCCGIVCEFIAIIGAIFIASTSSFVAVNQPPLGKPGEFSITIVTALISIVTGSIIARQAINNSPKFVWIRKLAVFWAATNGTSFYGVDLTDACFDEADLRHTDFRRANLTRASFQGAKNLDLARFEDTILQDPRVRKLLVETKDNKEKDFTNADLKGANLNNANLKGANLKGANICDATFRKANLEDANLVLTQAIGTDFTEAKMTGVCLEAWNIEDSTKLNRVECRYVYLLEKPKKDTDNRERRPSSGSFVEDEFTKLFEEVLHTVDFIFRNGIDWRAFLDAFQKLRVENEGVDLIIQRIENKGDGVFVIRVNVPNNADKAKIHHEGMQNYELALEKLEARYNLSLRGANEQLAIYRQQNSDLLLVINKLADRPVTIEVKATAESKSMNDSNDQSQNISVGGDFNIRAENAVVSLREMSGNVTNIINQLPSSSQPEQQGIKELLEQLKETIERSTELSDKDKVKALKQIQKLAEVSQNPSSGGIQDAVDAAITMLRGTLSIIPKLLEECNKLLPMIANLFGLG
jgi:uncharacterized protein YjbI with pentapeptide repeats